MRASTVPPQHRRTIDTCGTGGDWPAHSTSRPRSRSSSPASGVPVAKHGNRAVRRSSGAADVLEALGVNIDAPVARPLQRDGDVGIGFLFAPDHHAATTRMRRRPGASWACARSSTCSGRWPTRRARRASWSASSRAHGGADGRGAGAARLGTAWVVHGQDGLDELTTHDRSSSVAELRDGVDPRVRDRSRSGRPPARPTASSSAATPPTMRPRSCAADGAAGAYRDIVVLNAAAALMRRGQATTCGSGAELGRRRDRLRRGATASLAARPEQAIRMSDTLAEIVAAQARPCRRRARRVPLRTR